MAAIHGAARSARMVKIDMFMRTMTEWGVPYFQLPMVFPNETAGTGDARYQGSRGSRIGFTRDGSCKQVSCEPSRILNNYQNCHLTS